MVTLSTWNGNYESMRQDIAVSNLERSQKWNLQKKLRTFLRPKTAERNEICKFIDDACSRADVFIVGGLLRDLHIYGSARFSSDIDLVINQMDLSEFDSWLGRLDAKKNRFGGYSLNLGCARFDLWHLQRTWAHVAGYCEVRKPADLHNTTFFDWDCILYSTATGKILADKGYFRRVANRVLGIRLAHNPNPLGNAVRALRYACKYNASFDVSLASHVAKEMRDSGWSSLVSYERRSFTSRYLESMDGDMLAARIFEFEKQGMANSFKVVAGVNQLHLY